MRLRMAAIKEIMKALIYPVFCSDCGQGMPRIADDDRSLHESVIQCENPSCRQYRIRFEQPRIELEKADV